MGRQTDSGSMPNTRNRKRKWRSPLFCSDHLACVVCFCFVTLSIRVCLCEHLYVTILHLLLTFFKEREIERFIQPEEPGMEPQPEETPVQGIQLAGHQPSSSYLSLHLALDLYMICVVLYV